MSSWIWDREEQGTWDKLEGQKRVGIIALINKILKKKKQI